MKPVTFLLVDDLAENLLSLEALLRRDGLAVLKARSGDEALELLLEHEVALALIDVQMPGLDGFELAELMRGNERTRHIPIIFVTAGVADGKRRFRGYETGAVDFIQKPIEPDILRSKADVFFELYRQRQQITAQRDELEAQAKELREADRRKDEFLATLAHELRNPLAPLRHGLDVLRMNPDSQAAPDIRNMMDRQLAHLVRLIDDLLDVSRISQGKIELRRQRVSVEDIVRSAVESSRPLVEASGHSLSLNATPEALWLDADATRLSQVVGNLLNNSAKYTPEGGRIEVAARKVEGDAVIEVSDTGIGIPEEKLTEVFRLFAQLEDRLQHSQGGLGIGLALVKQLVDLHGGTVRAANQTNGTGSVFTVRLPLASSASQLEEDKADSASPPSRRLKVLLVDDNTDVAYMLELMLEELGHECRIVNDGRDALRQAKDYGPDIVLLDIGLPGMDGYEVCRAFRRDEQFAGMPIIAQTGWGQSGDKQKASEAGFNHHLTKPVSLDELDRVLQSTAGELPV